MKRIADETLALIIISLLLLGLVVIALKSVSAEETSPVLTREEQIELMKECLNDANPISLGIGMYKQIMRTNIAAAFFEYRTRR